MAVRSLVQTICTRFRNFDVLGHVLGQGVHEKAVVDVLAAKARQALKQTGLKRLAVGGGVAANRSLRTTLEQMTRAEGAELFIPPLTLCTDNAAMAAIAVEKWKQQQCLDLHAIPVYQ